MSRLYTFSKTLLALSIVAALLFTACTEYLTDTPTPNITGQHDFHIAFANGTGNPSGTLVQGVVLRSDGNITPISSSPRKTSFLGEERIVSRCAMITLAGTYSERGSEVANRT